MQEARGSITYLQGQGPAAWRDERPRREQGHSLKAMPRQSEGEKRLPGGNTAAAHAGSRALHPGSRSPFRHHSLHIAPKSSRLLLLLRLARGRARSTDGEEIGNSRPREPGQVSPSLWKRRQEKVSTLPHKSHSNTGQRGGSDSHTPLRGGGAKPAVWPDRGLTDQSPGWRREGGRMRTLW